MILFFSYIFAVFVFWCKCHLVLTSHLDSLFLAFFAQWVVFLYLLPKKKDSVEKKWNFFNFFCSIGQVYIWFLYISIKGHSTSILLYQHKDFKRQFDQRQQWWFEVCTILSRSLFELLMDFVLLLSAFLHNTPSWILVNAIY